MRYVYVIMVLSLLCLGCTAPTQPWAEKNLQIGQDKYDEVVKSLADISYQSALDTADNIVRVSENGEERSNALIKMSDKYHQVSYLEVQAGRAGELIRNGREWVHSQRGVLNILWEDIQEATKRVEDKTPKDEKPIPVVNVITPETKIVDNKAPPVVGSYDYNAVEIKNGDDK